jgi:hypothetical protein
VGAVAEIVVLGVLSAFWPTLLLIVLVALRTPHPPRVLIAFLAGGLLTCIGVGIAVVDFLHGRSIAASQPSGWDPAVYFAGSAASFLTLFAVGRIRRRPRRRRRVKPHKAPSWPDRMVRRGVIVSFLAGVVLNIVPGFVPFIALRDIAQLNASTSASVALIAIFYVLMFSFVEVPLAAYGFRPTETAVRVERFNGWLTANSGRLAADALVVLGVYLAVRGVVAAV